MKLYKNLIQIIKTFESIFYIRPPQETFTRFDILDGFRGILAMSVVLQHVAGKFLNINIK
jgi:hypothetical protein